ncbi:MAG: response regulator [Chloroflexi bacterium]|nr:response regulator [Chloroflexota bacterium]
MQSNERILIVEDDETLVASLREWLEIVGYQVITALNGRTALGLLEYSRPDIILSDITMPEMDGYEFLEAVRSQPQFATIPFMFLTGRSQRQDAVVGRGLGADDYITKPCELDDLLVAIRGKIKRAQDVALAQLHSVYKDSLTVLANAIETRDSYTRGHVERVSTYAVTIARELGCTDQELADIEFGAILHDIGKIAVSESILTKPGALTETERHELYKHPETGAAMVRDISYLVSAIPAIQHHHERFDGAGYPGKLAGDSIPLTARVLAVADAFDAITSNRPYRRARSLAEATIEIHKEAGRQFDPRVVNAFQQALGKGLITDSP